MTKASTREELLAMLAPVVSDAGLDLEELEVTPAGKRRIVRVVVDKDGGASLDDIAVASSSVSSTLDAPEATDVLGGAPYVLEVTSPGVDRPLTEPRHWRRATGRLVRVPLHAGGDVQGRIRSASEDTVVLDVDGTERSYPLRDLGRGKIQVEFARPAGTPAPGADCADSADSEDEEV
jgi:ribosome maturation factor RimP